MHASCHARMVGRGADQWTSASTAKVQLAFMSGSRPISMALRGGRRPGARQVGTTLQAILFACMSCRD